MPWAITPRRSGTTSLILARRSWNGILKFQLDNRHRPCSFIELMPRLTRIAGFEWGSGFYINPTPPEVAAETLRDVEV